MKRLDLTLEKRLIKPGREIDNLFVKLHSTHILHVKNNHHESDEVGTFRRESNNNQVSD
jgi:hypothetical protein